MKMKKHISILILGFISFTSQSQGIDNALLYAQDNLDGTARFSAISGAFGVVGGDFSAISVNPAGAAIFANNQVGITLGNYNVKNNSDYFGTNNSENRNAFKINQFGGIFVFNNSDSKSNWKKFTLAINYQNTNNYNNSLISIGTNPNNSVTNYFASVANSIRVPVTTLENYYYDELTLREQIAFLGYQGYLINANLPLGYSPNIDAGNFYQESFIESKGYNGKVAFNIATQYKDRFYFGLNLNAHFTDYRKVSNFYEENDNSSNGLRYLEFETDLHTYGNGFSMQMGAIAKVTKSFRAGLSYQSPTWYTLTDELLQTISTTGFTGSTTNPDANPDSNVLVTYEPYKLKTPGKWTGSLAYVFGKKGLLSVDYSVKDYSSTKYRPDDSFFSPTNSVMKNSLTLSNELRIGGEFRIKQWSLRGGYRTEQSPYKNGKTIGDLTGYSGGFGYNFGNTKLDMSYSHSQRKTQQGFFEQGFTDAPTINSKNNTISMTLLFEL
jgi:hypothetical protein